MWIAGTGSSGIRTEDISIDRNSPCFYFYHFPYYDYTSPGYVRYEQNFLGNLLYSKYGSKVVAIALHQPFPNRLNRQPALLSPALGRLETIMGRRGNKPIGLI